MMSKWVKGYKLICNSRGVYSLQDKKFGKTDYCVGSCVCVPRFQTYTNPLSEGRNWKWEHECEANGYELSNCYAAGPLHVSVYEYKAPSNCINVLAKDPDEAFIKYCGLHEYPSPDQDSYGWARLCQVIGNFFGGSLSVGIKPYTHDVQIDPGDNGIYVIKNWKIVERLRVFGKYGEAPYVEHYPEDEEQTEYDISDLLKAINDSMSESERLSRDFFG